MALERAEGVVVSVGEGKAVVVDRSRVETRPYAIDRVYSVRLRTKRPAFLPLLWENQLFMLALLGWLVFWAIVAVGASGGGDLSQGERAKTRIAMGISVVAYGFAILAPTLWPEHVPVAWRIAALGTVTLSLLVGLIASVWQWRSASP